MSTQGLLHVDPYTPVPRPIEQLEYADLPIVDLVGPAQSVRAMVIRELIRDTVKTSGFMYVMNHGHTPAQVPFSLFEMMIQF
ncbi:hypothetical protein OE88DRAFT_1740037 [Heliocybe sulcata]|uniref:Non-haem dioxygenase N-terminal domain-containing protein n=1 Tax=Heliocybe sulcata TaxID=5364 RepID=A0A5C3MK30_9AGAM|nr:hypothetical protein OE88DRAFT_1740037 [Heliocybe sulcata]